MNYYRDVINFLFTQLDQQSQLIAQLQAQINATKPSDAMPVQAQVNGAVKTPEAVQKTQ